MKILLTVNAAWNALNFRRPVIQALLNRGHDVTILAPEDQASAQLRRMGCQVVDLKMDVKGLSPRQDAILARRLAQHFKTIQPHVILSYTVKNNIFGAIAAKRLGIPFVPNISGLGTGFLSGGALRLVVETLCRFAFRDLPILFFQNTDDQELFWSRKLATAQQSRLLPGSGIDLDHFQSTPFHKHEGTVFLMISRPLRDKGVMEYVQAARQLKQTNPDLRFQLLGPTDAANRSAVGSDELDQWQREGIIEHLGEHADVRPFIAKADCVVLPSYREGAPRSLLEASSMARPIIATDVPGCRQVVSHGISGLLCKARNANSLMKAMGTYAAMETETRVNMGGAGRDKMLQEYDQAIVVRRYLSAISELTTPSRKRTGRHPQQIHA